MELSEQTIGVLRNYATINPNIVVFRRKQS